MAAALNVEGIPARVEAVPAALQARRTSALVSAAPIAAPVPKRLLAARLPDVVPILYYHLAPSLPAR